VKTQDLVNECIRFFNCPVSDSIIKRKKTFLCKHSACYDNDICSVFANNALDELSQLPGS